MTTWTSDDGTITLHHGDCRDVLKGMASESVHSIVTDPPYELGFMGKAWDRTGIAYEVGVWRECLRVLKPGGHLLAFGGSRTYHRLATAVEDAGFEIRDQIMWVYGSGFPKGLNVVNQLIKMVMCQSNGNAPLAVQCSLPSLVAFPGGKEPIAVALAQILPVGGLVLLTEIGGVVGLHVPMDTWPLTWEANIGLNMIWSWNGSLDDACKGASKSITETASKTITDPKTWNWLTGLHTSRNTIPASATIANGYGWPALNAKSNLSGVAKSKTGTLIVTALGSATWNPVARSRGFNISLKPAHEPIVVARKPLVGTVAENVLAHGTGGINVDGCRVDCSDHPGVHKSMSNNLHQGYRRPWRDGSSPEYKPTPSGRFPANLIHDGSEEVLAGFPETTSGTGAVKRASSRDGHGNSGGALGAESRPEGTEMVSYGDSGSAGRFFYCAKASRSDRNEGLDGLPLKRSVDDDWVSESRKDTPGGGQPTPQHNHHPTVKPTALMRYLCRLITPPGGVVLDPFTGSGSTGKAAALEGFRFVGIELEADFFEIAKHRIANAVSSELPARTDCPPPAAPAHTETQPDLF